MITSSSNAQVKNIIALNKKAKERREQDVFVAEGWKMFQEAPREWLKKVYVSESGSKMHEMPSDGTEYEVVDDRVFQSMFVGVEVEMLLCLYGLEVNCRWRANRRRCVCQNSINAG